MDFRLFSIFRKRTFFDPKKYIKYKRGDIVEIHLGYRIGSEEGGLHYAVVIDNNNSKANNTVTVIPLSSVRAGRKIHDSSVKLEDELFTRIAEKHRILFLEAIDKMNEFVERFNEANELGITQEAPAALLAQSQRVEDRLEELELLKKELNRMKAGSVALVNQITTISKIRIYDPLYTHSVLYGIRLSPASNEKIKELYIF